MAYNVQTLRESLKRVDYCQPMQENSIELDLLAIKNCLEFLVDRELTDALFGSEAFTQPPNKNFFTLELPQNASKYIIEFKQFINKNNDQVAQQILSLSMQLSLKVYQELDQSKALETIRYIIDPDRQFYRFNNQLESDEARFTQDVQLSAEQLIFCQSIEIGDDIDCLKIDSKQLAADWSRATVKNCNDRYVWVDFQMDDTYRKVYRYSWDLAPYKSKVPDEDWNWRMNLQVGDVVDCPDDNVWYNATVVERTEGDQTLVKIGFRHYDPKGMTLDARVNQRFFGWHHQYDEDMNITNPRIQRRNRYSKAFCKYASISYAEESIKDQTDFFYQYMVAHKVYAVPRFNTRNLRKSAIIVNLIQEFGRLGGFQLVLDKIGSKQNWCPIDVTSTFLAILGNMHENLSRQFCYEYVPQLWEVSLNNILNSPDSNLRNFSSQKITDALNGLGLLLKRVYSLREKTEMIEKLEMNVALKCFNSDFLERKLQGLKSIQDLLKKTKDYQTSMSNSDIRFLTIQVMVEWINENKIFEMLFVQNTNPHLIQRSSDFLKFMLDEHLVTIEQMEMVWASARRNETEQKLAVYKVLKDVSSSLSKEHLDFLVDRVCEKDVNTLSKDDVELLGDLTRYNYQYREQFCPRFCDFYWSLLLVKANEQLIQYFIDQVNSFEMRPHRQQILLKIGKSIMSGECESNVGLKVLQKLIERLEPTPLQWDNFTRNIALTELESNYNFMEEIIAKISNLKASYANNQLTQQELFDDIKGRMNFIQFFYSNITTNEHKLSFKVISKLWDELVCKSTLTDERDLLYKWFSTLANCSTLMSISQDELKAFFDEKMSDDTQLVELTLEGFNCFKAVYIVLNIQMSNISQLQSYSTYGGYGGITNNPYVKESKTEIVCKVSPMTHYGFKALWSIITDAKLLAVSKVANDFLQEMYSNLEAEHQRPMLDVLFGELSISSSNERIYRILLVLEDVINQSEVNGQGNLKSLNALRSSEVVTIPVINEHNSGPLIPKKITVEIQETATIIELRLAISKQIRAPWDTIMIFTTKGEVKFTENGKMVKDLRLKKGETLIVNKRYAPELNELPLLDAENNLTAEAKVVFAELFEEYSSNSKMNKEQCARFVTACTGNPCSQDDTQISRTFEQHDKDKDGLLTLNDFVEFYTDAARSKKSTVWQNLHTLNYRNDFLRGDRVPLPNIDSNNLPRSIITRSPQWMTQLFGLLDSPNLQLQEQAWYLLRRLPPSPEYFKKLVTFEGITTPQDWDNVFSISSNFRLLYSLHIVEFLMSNNTDSDIHFHALFDQATSSEQASQLRDKWMSEFLQLGGFDRLFQFFKNYEGRSVSGLDLNEKEILSFLLNTFSQYLVAACVYNQGYRTSHLLINQFTAGQTLNVLRTQNFEEPAEYKNLVAKLKDGLGAEIIKMFQLDTFVPVLISIIQELLTSQRDLETEDRSIIEYSLLTLVAVLLHDKRLAEQCMNDENFLGVFIGGLHSEKSSSVRGIFSRALLLFSYQCEQSGPRLIILKRMIQQLEENKSLQQDFYDLLCTLIDSACELGDGSHVEFPLLAKNVIESLMRHTSTESRAKNSQIDGVLLGLLNLLEKLISLKPEIVLKDDADLVTQIFNECLFSIEHPIKEVKCKSQETRAVAYKLLLSLAKSNHQQLDSLLGGLQQLSQRIPQMNKWNYIPASDMRSPNGYVGIRNLGSICYMNAMLQQFYMTQTFRYGILMADDMESPRWEIRPSDQARIDDNLLHQIQSMFAHLELSDRVDFNPHEFCFAFKDFSGEPVNVLLQQDAQEFLNMIFDKLESALKPTPFRYIMDGVYGGKTCTQLVCSQCQNVRKKEEQYYNLSLPIKNLKNLHECFAKYIEGEIISDFSCDACGQKVDVTKRQLLSSLPNVLILHLQRIVFNLDSLMNEKINTRLEFPHELDLKEYTVDDIPHTNYKLSGVVVHYGTAEYGHYFSYIDIKNQQEQWLEFNDSKIKEFKIKQLEQECFGGATNDNQYDDEMWGWGKYNRENSQNAYILVYEKVVKEPIKLIFQDREHLSQAQEQLSLPKELNITEEQDHLVVSLEYDQLKPYVPEELSTRVSNDNQQFLLERNLFSPELQKFLSDTLLCIDESVPQETKDQLSEVLIKFSFDLLARAYDNKQLDVFVSKLKDIMTVESCLKFLDQYFFNKLQKTIDLLLVCPDSKTRSLYAKLLCSSFVKVFNHYVRDQDLDIGFQNDDPFRKQDEREIIVGKIIRGLKLLLRFVQEQVPKNWIRLESYFQFWLDFMEGGDKQQLFMSQNDFLILFTDFILEKQSPLKLYEKKHSMGNSYYSINYENILLIIKKLTEYTISTGGKLSYSEKQLLYSYKLYDKVMRNLTAPSAITALCELCCRLAHEDMYFSEIICGCVLRGISRADQDEMQTQLTVLQSLVKLRDSYKQYRLEWLIGVPQLSTPNQSKSDLFHFGTYGTQSLDEDSLHFPSPLGWQSTILEYIVLNRSNKQQDNQCLLAIKCLLQLALEDNDVFQFILRVPSSNYLFKHFDDMLNWFVQQYMIDSKRYFYHNFARDAHAEETKKLLEQYQANVANLERAKCDFIIGKSVSVTQKRRYVYAVDQQTQQKYIIDELTPEGKLQLKELNSNPFFEKICTLEDRIFTAFICDNLPTGQGNEALPSQYVKGSQFYTYSVQAKTMAANFIQSKTWSPNNYYESEEETEEEMQTLMDQSTLPENQRVLNPAIIECVRQLIVFSSVPKQTQAVIRIRDPLGTAPHYVPKSPVQSIIQGNNQALLFTTKKNSRLAQFTHLDFELEIKSLDGERGEGHLYLCSVEEQDLSK